MEQTPKIKRNWSKELADLGINCAINFDKLNETGKEKLIEFFKHLESEDERRSAKTLVDKCQCGHFATNHPGNGPCNVSSQKCLCAGMDVKTYRPPLEVEDEK